MARNQHWDQLQGLVRHSWPFELRSIARAVRHAEKLKDYKALGLLADDLEQLARTMADAGENYRDGKPPLELEAED
jgi:hypothetical protein